jgi:hypothetical protein
MSMLEVALDCIGRGWHVFPCVPKTKRPLGGLVPNGVLDASNDETKVRQWWAAKPDANVAIACGPSGLSVVDCDHGNMTEADARAWMLWAGLPKTYTVHTGRRVNAKDGSPEFGVQLYYADTMPSVGEFVLGGGSGQVKSLGGYVMAAGSIHPDTGEKYELMTNAPVVPLPRAVRLLKSERKPMEDDQQPITENRNIRLTSIAGKLRNAGLSATALELALLQVNAERCLPPLDEEEVKRIAASVARYAIPEQDPVPIIGKPVDEPSDDPWAKYHTADQILNAPPVTFLIDGFLTEDAITVIAAPVAQRKSILALNVVHSLVTGEPLFGHFPVKQRPSRVLYCCPEMGIQSFSARLKSIGLAPYLGKTLFCTTMASDPFELKDITPDELKGAVVVLDTAIRFLKGDESNAAEMSVFAATVFRLIKDGAASVLLLHHSKKGTSDAAELTLDNVMRGSGELGAFVACVWATRLQDGKDEYRTPSYLENVKKRDFDSKPFQVLPVEGSYRLLYDAKGEVVLSNPSRFKRDKDGKEELALALIAATRQTKPTMSYVELSRMLQEHGIDRSAEWIRKRDKRSGITHRSD